MFHDVTGILGWFIGAIVIAALAVWAVLALIGGLVVGVVSLLFAVIGVILHIILSPFAIIGAIVVALWLTFRNKKRDHNIAEGA
jgi:predicted membrane chloride channel (bestrophin family)